MASPDDLDHREPTSDELRRVARWLATVGYLSAAGQCHRKAWQLEQLAEQDRRFGQPHYGHDDAQTG